MAIKFHDYIVKMGHVCLPRSTEATLYSETMLWVCASLSTSEQGSIKLSLEIWWRGCIEYHYCGRGYDGVSVISDH